MTGGAPLLISFRDAAMICAVGKNKKSEVPR